MNTENDGIFDREVLLTPGRLSNMAARMVVVRAWRKVEDGVSTLTIDLVAKGVRLDPPSPLIHARYHAAVPFKKYLLFSNIDLSSLDVKIKMSSFDKVFAEITNSWYKLSPHLCRETPSLAFDFGDDEQSPSEIPVGRLDLMFQYMILRTLLSLKINWTGKHRDEAFLTLHERFDSFLRREAEKLGKLGELVDLS